MLPVPRYLRLPSSRLQLKNQTQNFLEVYKMAASVWLPANAGTKYALRFIGKALISTNPESIH